MQLKIQQYTILSNIGCGSEHLVYKAQYMSLSEQYAIKIEKSSRTGQLENEIKILKKLKGIEGVPKVQEFGKINEQKCFIVLPLLYCNLKELVESQPLTFSIIFKIGLNVIEILEKIHKQNILHLDIKLENIMLSKPILEESDILQPGFIQLIDYGLSQQFMENSESLQDVFIGSLNFASRSSHDGAPLGYKDDLESLFYVLCYLKDLGLPWTKSQHWGFKDNSMESIRKAKISFVNSMILNQKSQPNFSRFISYIESLQYDVMPDYTYIKELFVQMIKPSSSILLFKKQQYQPSILESSQKQLNNSETLTLCNDEIIDEMIVENKEEDMTLVSNLIDNYRTIQIRSIKDIKL